METHQHPSQVPKVWHPDLLLVRCGSSPSPQAFSARVTGGCGSLEGRSHSPFDLLTTKCAAMNNLAKAKLLSIPAGIPCGFFSHFSLRLEEQTLANRNVKFLLGIRDSQTPPSHSLKQEANFCKHNPKDGSLTCPVRVDMLLQEIDGS